MNKSRFVLATLWLPILAIGSTFAQSGQVDIRSHAWEKRGEVVASDNVLGRPALQMRTGQATLPNVGLMDGTIEFDMAVTGHRSFVYILVRRGEEGEQEEIYFRPHKSSLPDAIQYSPVYKRASNWQLFHGPGYTGAVDLPSNQWIPVRLILQGRKAALFVGDLTKPRLLIPLERKPQAGGIALRSFLPQGKPEGIYPASFSNLRIKPGIIDYDFSRVTIEAPSPPVGAIGEWLVSPPFEAKAGTVVRAPGADRTQWRKLATEPWGLLLLGKDVTVPEKIETPAVYARVTIRAAEAVTKRFNLGFSDVVTVFLNGKPLFSGDASYSFDNPRREGLIGLDQATLYLPLEKGENELVLAVSETFGGWGLMGQFPDSGGIEVDPR